MAIAEKYHYEDAIYSYQLLNPETAWVWKRSKEDGSNWNTNRLMWGGVYKTMLHLDWSNSWDEHMFVK